MDRMLDSLADVGRGAESVPLWYLQHLQVHASVTEAGHMAGCWLSLRHPMDLMSVGGLAELPVLSESAESGTVEG